MTTLLNAQQALHLMRENTPLLIAVCDQVRPLAQAGRLPFYCAVCRSVQRPFATDDWNLRNALQCTGCGQGGRQRHAFEVLEGLLRKDLYPQRIIFEEVTPFKALIDARLGPFRGSEYLGPDCQGGQAYDYGGRQVVHEDIGALSLPDASVDLAVSMDVLEHVPSVERALRECHRVLKPGGVFMVTVPFYDAKPTLRRADVVDGQIVHILPAEFHGNPVSADGALVFTEPGIDLIDTMHESGFDVQISLGANLEHGLLSDGNRYADFHCWNLVFVLTRP